MPVHRVHARELEEFVDALDKDQQTVTAACVDGDGLWIFTAAKRRPAQGGVEKR